jgi:hypothetical protein
VIDGVARRCDKPAQDGDDARPGGATPAMDDAEMPDDRFAVDRPQRTGHGDRSVPPTLAALGMAPR